nr:MAG TPA: hypothetical protein [Caudoviricetes sp.]
MIIYNKSKSKRINLRRLRSSQCQNLDKTGRSIL